MKLFTDMDSLLITLENDLNFCQNQLIIKRILILFGIYFFLIESQKSSLVYI